MNNLHYKDYGCFNSKVVEVQKFWCVLYKLCGIQTIEKIFDFIASNYPIKIEYYKKRNRRVWKFKYKIFTLSYKGQELIKEWIV